MMVAVLSDTGQFPLEIVHLKVYVPANVIPLAVVLFTFALLKFTLAPVGWLTIDQVPTSPGATPLPAKIAVLIQIDV
ncbi:MAG: hypothetical protein EAY75_05745 [Bacteroidetes bacterium]|nr:MAG: hypothetical protein EAY75_05745 [Bacteroidota bacterium]